MIGKSNKSFLWIKSFTIILQLTCEWVAKTVWQQVEINPAYWGKAEQQQEVKVLILLLSGDWSIGTDTVFQNILDPWNADSNNIC
jgi:hypothetical protein